MNIRAVSVAAAAYVETVLSKIGNTVTMAAFD